MKKKTILGVIENCTKNVIVQGFEFFLSEIITQPYTL